ncbi:MAG: hypothetical protein KBS74_00980 [Clostridiales bacterium]|nr:hypothetical protein [Candidatus Cacconaster stercorequi]
MFYIWWPGFLAALLVFFCGLVHLPPYKKHTDWPAEKQSCAAKAFYRLLWQMGLLFAALCFMLMRSTRMMSTTGQYILLGVLLVVMAAAVLFIDVPVRNAVEQEFDGEDAE